MPRKPGLLKGKETHAGDLQSDSEVRIAITTALADHRWSFCPVFAMESAEGNTF